jgi:hypothetical protein
MVLTGSPRPNILSLCHPRWRLSKDRGVIHGQHDLSGRKPRGEAQCSDDNRARQAIMPRVEAPPQVPHGFIPCFPQRSHGVFLNLGLLTGRCGTPRQRLCGLPGKCGQHAVS